MDQKKLKAFRERLVVKKQEILEAYNKNKTYGKEADEEGAQDIADKASNSYTKEFLFSLSNTERDMLQLVDEALVRIDDRTLRRVRGVRGRDGQEAAGGGALGQALHLLPGEAGAGPAVSAAATRVGLTLAAAARAPGRSRAGRWSSPPRCPACAAPLDHPRSGPLCEACWARCPATAARSAAAGCRSCRRTPRACGRCRRGLSPFARGASLGPYEGACARVVHELKYRGRRRAAGRLAAAPRTASRGCGTSWPAPTCSCPCPCIPAGGASAGFNQSELLAAALARRGAAPGLPRAPWCGARDTAARRA